MKIAISGKGGVGKSTLAAALSLLLARNGQKVLAVDADPDANLAAALGIPVDKQKMIVPISKQIALIEERTGAKVKQYGQIFKLNPNVSDITNKYALNYHGIALLVLGAVEQGGGGCACPENVLLRALVTDLILYKDETLVMDMEAGVEHLGRATARGVDILLVVLEPGQRSVDSANRIIRMANEIDIHNIQLIANKTTNKDDEIFLQKAFPNRKFIANIPYSREILDGDRSGRSVLDGLSQDLQNRFEDMLNNIEVKIQR